MNDNMSEKVQLRSALRSKVSHYVALGNEDSVFINFDLDRVPMTEEQRRTVLKLFSQNPVLVVTDEEHRHSQERGMNGPASQYLTTDEFESIRELGVRLGTRGELVATVCDFCLHCVKLEALPARLNNLPS